MEKRKYILSINLYKKYRKLANERYKKFGCEDKLYKVYCKIIRFTATVVNVNGWDNCLAIRQY